MCLPIFMLCMSLLCFLPAWKLVREDKVKGQSFLLVYFVNENYAGVFFIIIILPGRKASCVLESDIFDLSV